MNVYIVVYRDETQVKEERVHQDGLKDALDYIFKNNLELIGVMKL